MANVVINDNHLTNIANAIREKNGTNDTYKPNEMANAINNIETGIEPTGTLEITENGSYDIKNYANANVNVASGGGDISEYFDENINGGTIKSIGWANTVLKTPVYKFNGTNASYMFYAYPLPNVDLTYIDTSKTTTITHMFEYSKIQSVDINKLVVNKVTNANSLFSGCEKLKQINMDNMDFASCTDFGYMFNGAKITDLSMKNVNMSKVNTLSCFIQSTNVKNLDMTNCDMSSVNSINSFACTSLTNLVFGLNLGKNYTRATTNYSSYKLQLNACSNLTHDSLMSVINNLYDLNLTYDVANGGTLYTQSLLLGSKNIAKLTTIEEIAIATNKGWTVS